MQQGIGILMSAMRLITVIQPPYLTPRERIYRAAGLMAQDGWEAAIHLGAGIKTSASDRSAFATELRKVLRLGLCHKITALTFY